MAEAVNAQLDQMQSTLSMLVNKINESHPDEPDNVVGKITEVLNSHLVSLQWIEHTCGDLNSKLSQVEKLYATQITRAYH